MPIIPSLNTIHHAPNASCNIRHIHALPTLLHMTGVEMHMCTTLIPPPPPSPPSFNVFIGSRCLWDEATCTPRLNTNCC